MGYARFEATFSKCWKYLSASLNCCTSRTCFTKSNSLLVSWSSCLSSNSRNRVSCFILSFSISTFTLSASALTLASTSIFANSSLNLAYENSCISTDIWRNASTPKTSLSTICSAITLTSWVFLMGFFISSSNFFPISFFSLHFSIEGHTRKLSTTDILVCSSSISWSCVIVSQLKTMEKRIQFYICYELAVYR